MLLKVRTSYTCIPPLPPVILKVEQKNTHEVLISEDTPSHTPGSLWVDEVAKFARAQSPIHHLKVV